MDTIPLSDGRQLAVHRLAEGTRTVLLCHPAPGSGRFDPDPEATAARGITLLSADRPGYGHSSPSLSSGLNESADDLAQALDHLGTGPVGLAGWSAGGLVALSLAARRPDLVDRLVLIATPAPDDEVPWIPPGLRSTREAVRDRSAAALTPFTVDDPDRWVGLLGDPEPDRTLAGQPDIRDRLTAMLREAFVQGPAGLAADLAACLDPWDIDLTQVTAKTLLLYGAKDPLVGPRHARWYQPRLPSARFEQIPGAAHLTVIPMWKRALTHLTPGPRRPV